MCVGWREGVINGGARKNVLVKSWRSSWVWIAIGLATHCCWSRQRDNGTILQGEDLGINMDHATSLIEMAMRRWQANGQ